MSDGIPELGLVYCILSELPKDCMIHQQVRSSSFEIVLTPSIFELEGLKNHDCLKVLPCKEGHFRAFCNLKDSLFLQKLSIRLSSLLDIFCN